MADLRLSTDLREWIKRRISMNELVRHRVHVNGLEYVPVLVAERLFEANEKLAARYVREKRRRKLAEAVDTVAELRAAIAGANCLIKSWRGKAIAHGYTDEYVERERDAATSGKAQP